MTQTAEIIQLETHRVEASISDGFVKVANAILLQRCQTVMNDRQGRVYAAIIAKTFGYNKSMDWISNDQIEELTGIARNHVSEVKRELISRKIIVKDGRKIGINQVVSDWVLTPKPKAGKSQKVPEQGLNKSPNLGTAKSQPRDSKVPEQGLISPNLGTHKRQNNITKDNTTKYKGIDLANIPPWLTRKTICEFIDHRKAIKKPMTQAALSKLINKLSEFIAKGFDPIAALDESIMNGWQGVFEPKQTFNQNSLPAQNPKATKRQAVTSAVMNIKDTDW